MDFHSPHFLSVFLVKLSHEFTGDGLIIYDQDHTMFAAADGAAQTFPVNFSFNGRMCRDCFCCVTFPLGKSCTNIFFPDTILVLFFQMEFNGIEQNIFVGIVCNDNCRSGRSQCIFYQCQRYAFYCIYFCINGCIITAAAACLVGISSGRLLRLNLPTPIPIAPDDTRIIS